MKIGYARVSTRDQNLDMQLDALAKLECTQVYQEEASGASMQRPVLDEALAYLRPGDTLVVWKLDRLGRTLSWLVKLAEELRQREIHLHSVTDGIDTSTPAGRFFFNVMASMAEMERDQLRERTRAGLAAARGRGRPGGRRFAMTPVQLEAARGLIAGGASIREAARRLEVPRNTLHNNLKRAASMQ